MNMKFLYTKEKAEDLKKQLEMSGSGGKDGDTPFINSAGNWQIGDIDTGNKAQGPQGIQGKTGPQGKEGPKGDTGPKGIQGKTGPQGEVGPKGLKGDKGDSGTNIINQNDSQPLKVWVGTQSEYDEIPKNDDTLYMVKAI